MFVTRRVFSIALAVSALLGWRFAAAQGNIYGEASRIRTALQNATSIEEVATLAIEWDEKYRAVARTVNADYASDLDMFLEAVHDKIKGTLMEPVTSAFLRSLAPRMYAVLQRIPKWISPMMAFLSALQPSNIASDAVELHLMNQAMQEHAYRAFTRVSGEPLWFSTLQNAVLPLPPPNRPTLHLP